MGYLLVAAAIVLAGIAWVVKTSLAARPPKLDFPVVGSPSDADFRYSVIEGVKKYPNSPFIIPIQPPRIIMPMSLYKEAMNMPSLSFNAEIYGNAQGQYTHMGEDRRDLIPLIRHDLTKSMNLGALSLLQDEARYAFDKELGRPQDWTTVPIYFKLLRIIAITTGRIFVGQPLNRDEEWLNASINFTTDIMAVFRENASWNPMLRPFVGKFLPSVKKVRQDLEEAAQWLAPLVNDILSGNQESLKQVEVGSRGTFMSWAMKYIPSWRKTATDMGISQMLISFASMHTTTITTCNAVLDLAARPQYIQPLREELENALKQDGERLDENGRPFITKESIGKLRKLDSFLKESQRLNPTGFSSVHRQATEDVVFSNGLKIPKGAHLGWPNWAVVNSPETFTYSAEYNASAGNPGPEVFDGFRFSKLREIPGRELKHQAVTTSPDQLNFGHGPNACPGRFFAIYLVKVILIELLRNWDFRLATDLDGTGGEEKRPKNVVSGMSYSPDPRAVMCVKRRKVP